MSTIEKALAKQKANSASPVVTQPVDQQNISETAASEQAITAQSTPEPAVTEQATTVSAVTPKKVLQLNKVDLSSRGYLIDTGDRKSIKDEFRQIKRKLLNNAFGAAAKTLNNPNLIMVTSSKPNEGKTFVSINLALSIALEQDKKVLLIDADVLRPSVNRELDVAQTDGLIEYLLGKKNDAADVMYDTDIDNLKLIPAGEPHHLSNELLASDKMMELANQLANRYPDRVVIFDCPPLIGVTETLVLANFMGQAVLVVEESKTLISDIEKATENLNEDLALGIVINKAIRSHKDMYGYYGYGYAK